MKYKKQIFYVLGGILLIPAILFIPIPKSTKKVNSNIKMPRDFLWGAATSAHQIEEGDVKSDWDRFEKVKGNIDNGDTTEIADDGYAKAFDDIKLIKNIGLNSYRFSIEWARVEPKRGQFDEKALKHYKDLVIALKKNGIEPIVTLHHFTNPSWIYDGGKDWSDKETEDAFINYLKKVTDYMNDEVKYWVTVNEPILLMRHSYKLGGWPPQKKNEDLYRKSLNNILDAHNKIYDYIKQKYPQDEVGVAFNFADYVPKRNNLLENIITKYYRYFTTWQWADKIRKKSDFIGVNYYARHYVGLGKPIINDGYKLEDLTDMGWNIQPNGLEHLLITLNKRYHKKIIIIENGLADAKDKKRARFIGEHIKAIKRAIKQGADVKGYMHWSLMDNFEWQAGYDMKFGLYEVNRETMERTARPSAIFYKDLVEREKNDIK